MDTEEGKLLREIHANTTVLSRLFEAHVQDEGIHQRPIDACPQSKKNERRIEMHMITHPETVKKDISLIIGSAVVASILGGGTIVYLITELVR